MSRCLVMEAWVYQNEIGVAPDEMGGFTLPGRELPPMTMPQQLLPEGKRRALRAQAAWGRMTSISISLKDVMTGSACRLPMRGRGAGCWRS